MSVNDQKFVVDTNALIRIGPGRRASHFFRERAVIPEFVWLEAHDFSDVASLKELVQPVSLRTLEILKDVMRTVPITDTRLVDLYGNLGNADPFVVANALELQEKNDEYLFAPEIYVVSSDNAVLQKTRELEIKVLTAEEFAEIVDSATLP